MNELSGMLVVPCDQSQYDAVHERVFNDWTYPEISRLPTLLVTETECGSRAPVAKLHRGWEMGKEADVIAYIHSDVEIYENGWWERSLKEFEDERVGVVGWGGAVRLGHPDLYKVPYEMSQLARFGYCSNVQDAETHGRREGGAVDVATLDGFCLIVRRKLLDKLGGWPYKQLPFHNYDNWLCAKAHALRYRVRMVGVYCKHLGGGHSVQTDWSDWAKQNLGKTDQQIHEESHTWLYETMRGVLPISVSGAEG